MSKSKSTWGGPNRNQGRKITKLRIGRGFTLAVGQQVLCRETFPDGVTPGKIGVIAIENNLHDGDYTIRVNFDDGSAFVIGVYKDEKMKTQPKPFGKVVRGELDEFGIFHEKADGKIRVRRDASGTLWCVDHNCPLSNCKDKH